MLHMVNVTHGSETWTLTKAIQNKLEAFENVDTQKNDEDIVD